MKQFSVVFLLSVLLFYFPVCDTERYHRIDRSEYGRRMLYQRPFVDTEFGQVFGLALDLGWEDDGSVQDKETHYYLGIPYAKSPSSEPRTLRFSPPQSPERWPGRPWNATYYRPACPQNTSYLSKFLENPKVSEDCMYLNIFTPYHRKKKPHEQRSYPVMVYIHGGQFKYGSGQIFPGNILAEEDIVVVTFNYRLGALGFLSTNDRECPGNVGYLDMIHALEWVRDHIVYFHGNRSRVTIVGQEAGAMAAGLLTVSPKAKGLFHHVITMSGSDLSEDALIEPTQTAMEYARELSRRIGCPHESSRSLVYCLRNSKSAELIANASCDMQQLDGPFWLGTSGGPWAAVVDGDFLPDHPRLLRERGKFNKVIYMTGVTHNEAAPHIASVPGVEFGISVDEFRRVVLEWIFKRGIHDYVRVRNAIEFEYTYWPQPWNNTARRQKLIDVFTDQKYGAGVDEAAKFHAYHDNRTHTYVFNHTSKLSKNPWWMGAVHGSELPYVYGEPYLDDPLYNMTGLKPLPKYDGLDRNISEFMINAWVNFVKVGNATPDPVANMTWLPFYTWNLTYCQIQNNSFVYKNYRQSHYGFWRVYFKQIYEKPFYTTTPYPTILAPTEVKVSAGALGALAVILVCVIFALTVTLIIRWRQTKKLFTM